MDDMASTIIPKSDQLNSDDLITGPITITITGVDIRSGQEQPISIHYEGDGGKPYKACKSMCRVMVSAWGPDSKKYAGRSMTLYRDPKVKWAGMEVGGIRISHMSDIDESMTMALTVTRANKKPFTVKPIVKGAPKAAAPVAQPPLDASPSGASDAAALITADEALKLEARCTENAIKIPVVKKHFGVERFAQMTGEQLAQAHAMIDSTLEGRKAAA